MIKKIAKSFVGLFNGMKYPVFDEKEKKTIPASARIAFVIPSVIEVSVNPFDYSSTRTVFSTSQRMNQTKNTIESIRRKCPGADIFLADAGLTDFKDELEPLTDHYLYLGNDKTIRTAADSKLKSLGETEILKKVFPLTESYDYTFKLSGRYYLSEDFCLSDYDAEHLNFKNYVRCKNDFPCGVSAYIKGSHSTRLFGVPKVLHNEFMAELYRIKSDVNAGISIEKCLGKYIKGKAFYYLKHLGCSGSIAVDGDIIIE